MDLPGTNIFQHRGYNMFKDIGTPESMDAMFDDQIRDSDVFQVTYPKSGTVWMQQILCLIYNEGHRNETENIKTIDQIPWIEYNLNHVDHITRSSPRLMTTHLPYDLVPRRLREKKGKVIYVHRNPKDVMASLHHFSKILIQMEDSNAFEDVLNDFLAGNGPANSWFDHLKGWYEHRDEFNILFMVYEEMVMDLKSAVLKICKFLEKPLDDEALNKVVERATFKNMKSDPKANYESLPGVIEADKGRFLRKGKIGDWKNVMTVAQNEKFDKVFNEWKKDVKHLPIKIIFEDPDDCNSKDA